MGIEEKGVKSEIRLVTEDGRGDGGGSCLIFLGYAGVCVKGGFGMLKGYRNVVF